MIKKGAIVLIRIASTRVRNTTVELCCRNIYPTTLRQLIIRFRQLLALSYHYLVSDQDFKKCCNETVTFKVECVCLQEMVVLEYLRQA